MTALLITNILFFAWIFTLLISAYATNQLYKHGPYNVTLGWEIFRKITDVVTSLAFGAAITFLFSEINHWVKNWFLLAIIFVISFCIARGILVVALRVVARPYLKREEEKRRYLRGMAEAEAKLREEGLYPKPPSFLDGPAAWEEFAKAIEVLRSQGKFPPVPKWMKKNS